jgi:LPXTG-motif cell wall-anchored protein
VQHVTLFGLGGAAILAAFGFFAYRRRLTRNS